MMLAAAAWTKPHVTWLGETHSGLAGSPPAKVQENHGGKGISRYGRIFRNDEKWCFILNMI